MALSSQSLFLICLLALVLLASPAHAFGAGNIGSTARIEGENFRHGDIEDTLLTLLLARIAGGQKFSKLDVKRVYFGNWLRDYSQAVDVGTVKYVSAEAIRILLWVLGFITFGYGTEEFEVTSERLGCYQPTEHIDNPKGYADGDDARRYDRRLRGPVDEERELAIDPRTGLKNYIASEDLGINTSAHLIRSMLGGCIEYGRRYARSGDKADLYEALRLMGTGLHCLEDYAAHSNYTELSLIELGERNVFPHVGRGTQIELQGAQYPVYPIVTGTFGGVDFFHSVLGEFSDKATQSELQSLEGAISDTQNEKPSQSILQGLLNKIPEGIIGGGQGEKMDEFKSKADEAKINNENITPLEPEEWTNYLDDVQRQILPVLEWHDDIMKTINEAIEKIPVLPELIEQVQDQISIFVFSVLAPYVLPILKQVKTELQTGSSEVIQSSLDQQHIVFNDDTSSDPTHSMLSKDHFSNVLNEPAGRIASQVVRWTVPQLMACWDDYNIDANRTLNRIIHGVFHHPALRQYGDDGAADIRQIMFRTVEEWWGQRDEESRDILRRQLSREGVFNGENHKEGVHDTGHGSCQPLKLTHHSNSGAGAGADSFIQSESDRISKLAEEAVGGSALGGLLGGIMGNVGSGFFGGESGRSETQSYEQREESSYNQWQGEESRPPRESYETRQTYQQQNYNQFESYGGEPRREEYGRSDQEERHFEEHTFSRQERSSYTESYGGGQPPREYGEYEQRTTRRGDDGYVQESGESYQYSRQGREQPFESESTWQSERRYGEEPRRNEYESSGRYEESYGGHSGGRGEGEFGREPEQRGYRYGEEPDERRYGSDNDNEEYKPHKHGHHHRHHHHDSDGSD